MTAIEAMIYCLGEPYDREEDGERHSRMVWDTNGQPHWFAWHINHGSDAIPVVCSEAYRPFAVAWEPYRAEK